MIQKYYVAYLLNFYAIYDAQNADNTRTLRIWFDDKLREVYATIDFTMYCQRVTVAFVTNNHCNPVTYLINCPKVNARPENVHYWYKHNLAHFYAIYWCELHQWDIH